MTFRKGQLVFIEVRSRHGREVDHARITSGKVSMRLKDGVGRSGRMGVAWGERLGRTLPLAPVCAALGAARGLAPLRRRGDLCTPEPHYHVKFWHGGARWVPAADLRPVADRDLSYVKRYFTRDTRGQ